MTVTTPPPPPAPPATGHTQRTLEDLHRDIEFANQYRLEFIKHTMTISAGIFAFTIAFQEHIIGKGPTHYANLALIAWIAMIISILAGLAQFVGWDRYYMTWRDYEWKNISGKTKRKVITFWRRVALVIQLVAFVAGLVLIAVFCAVNM